jgi:hypothetical protein
MACGLISKDQDASCPQPPGGTEPFFYVANSADVDSFGDDGASGFNTLTMKAGKFLYKYNGFRNDMKHKDEVVDPGVGSNQFLHDLGLVIYSRTQEDKDQVESLCKGNFIFIFANKGKDTSAIEVAGVTQGLEVVPGTIRDAHANGGFFVMEFKTPKDSGEPKLPQTFSLGAYQDSIDYLEALLEP